MNKFQKQLHKAIKIYACLNKIILNNESLLAFKSKIALMLQIL